MILGIPPAILMLLVGLLAGASAPFLVAAYQKLCVFVFKKTGVQLPDNAAIDADIPLVVKALAPILFQAVVTGHLDAGAALKAVQDAIAAAGGTPAQVAAVAPAMAAMHPEFAGHPAFAPPPGLR